MADVEGGTILPHTRELTEQACWSRFQVHREAFTDRETHFFHGVLQVDALGLSMIEDEVLTKCLNSGPLQVNIHLPKQPAQMVLPKCQLRDKCKPF